MRSKFLKCILHIGTEKTGSTAIQSCLYHQGALLKKHGLAVSQLLEKPSNRKLPSYFQSLFDDYFKDRGIHTPEERAKYFDGFLTELGNEFRELEQSGHHTLIVSSEHLHSRLLNPEEIESLKAFLDDHFSSVEIICYLREQSAVRKSLYSTYVRNGITKPIEEFQKHIKPGLHYYDYGFSLGKWEAVFGRDALSLAVFDPTEMPRNDIRRDFLRRVGVTEYADVPLFDVRLNESLPLGKIMACRMINSAIPRYNEAGELDRTRIALRDCILNAESLHFGKVVDVLGPEIFDRFDAVNSEVGRRYFGLDGNPFERPSVEAQAEHAHEGGIDELVRRELESAIASLKNQGFEAKTFNSIEKLISEGQFT